MKYLIVIEKTATGFSAYSPDLPGCVATGSTQQEVEHTMQEAMAFHVAGLRLEGQEPPLPQAYAQYIELSAQAEGQVSG